MTRYHNHADRSIVPELVYADHPLAWADEPMGARKDALPFASISWWWDDLPAASSTHGAER